MSSLGANITPQMALEELERRKSRAVPVAPDITPEDALKELERPPSESKIEVDKISPIEARAELARRGVDGISEADLLQDPNWIKNSKKVYQMNEGVDAPDLQSDREYAKYGIRYMGWFNYNLPKMGLEATQLRTATDDQKNAFVDLMEDYDRKEVSLAGTGRFAAGVLSDPTTYIGIGTFGAGLASREAAKQGIKLGVKESIKQGLTQGAKVGAIEGAVYSATDNALRQSTKIQAGRQEDFDFGESALSAGTGAVIGGTLGGGIGALAGRATGVREVVESDKTLLEGKKVDVDKEIAPYSEEVAQGVRDEIADLNVDVQPDLTLDVSGKAVDIGVELLRELNIPAISKDARISDQIFEVLQLAEKTPEYKSAFTNVLKRNNVTPVEFSQLFRLGAADAGRRLQQLSVAKKSFLDIGDELAGIAPKEPMGAKITKGIRELDNVRRGLLVSQMATSMRNFTAQIGRVGMHTLTNVYDDVLNATFNPLRKAFGAEAKPVDHTESFGLLLNLLPGKGTKKAKDITEFTTKYFVNERDRLFTNYASDVADATDQKTFKRAQKVVDGLNFLNRMQEYYYRRGMFAASLEKSLKKRNLTIQDVFDAGEDGINLINKADIEKAVDDALEFTYAKTPEGKFGQSVLNLANSVPFITTAIFPFARFMANAIEFQFKHSPLGPLSLFSQKERDKVASGDYDVFAKATIGSAVLLSTIEAKREGYLGDEKWYELRVGDKTYDMRPYFPLTPYMLVADIVVRNERGLSSPDAKDLIQGLTGAQLRAGVGLRLVDDFIDQLRGVKDEKKLNQFVSDFTSDVLGGFLTPIRMFGDFAEGFMGEEALKYREASPEGKSIIEDIGTRLQSSLPIAKELLPEAESPTRAEAPGRPTEVFGIPAGIAKQLTGVTAREVKNPAEREFDRLGFKRRDILPYSGDRKIDNLVAKNLGPVVEDVVSDIVVSSKYQSLSNPKKEVMLRKVLKVLRAPARTRAMAEDPQRFLRLRINRLPKAQRLMLREQNPEKYERLLED